MWLPPVVGSERDGCGVPHLSHAYQQLQRGVATRSGDRQADQGRRQRGAEGHRGAYFRPLPPVYITTDTL